jgi:hypothetical protein
MTAPMETIVTICEGGRTQVFLDDGDVGHAARTIFEAGWLAARSGPLFRAGKSAGVYPTCAAAEACVHGDHSAVSQDNRTPAGDRPWPVMNVMRRVGTTLAQCNGEGSSPALPGSRGRRRRPDDCGMPRSATALQGARCGSRCGSGRCRRGGRVGRLSIRDPHPLKIRVVTKPESVGDATRDRWRGARQRARTARALNLGSRFLDMISAAVVPCLSGRSNRAL